MIVGVGRGYGDADVGFVERGLERVVNVIGRGVRGGMIGGVGGLEGLIEKGWVEGCLWVEEGGKGWRMGFGGVVGVLCRGLWCMGGVGVGKGVRVGVVGKEWAGCGVGECHDVWNLDERERVERFGGFVEGGRVVDGNGGSLDVTRVCGCLRFRGCGVVGVPWVTGGVLGKKDRGLVVSTVAVVGKNAEDSGLGIFKDAARKRKGGGDVCGKLLDAAEGGIPKMQDMAVACVQVFW